jgi:ribosomal protein L29
MKFTELQKKAPADLDKELERIAMEMMKYKAQIATGGVGKETGKVRQLRRAVARIKTIKNAKEVRGKQ